METLKIMPTGDAIEVPGHKERPGPKDQIAQTISF